MYYLDEMDEGEDVSGDILDAPEVGRRRLGRRFGRALGAVFTGGASEIVRRARQRGRSRARQQAAQSSRPVTVGTGIVPSSQRQGPFGLGRTTTAAVLNTSFVLSAIVQKAFQPERLVVIASDSCEINDVKIGTRSQLIGVESLPVEAFAADATNTLMTFDPAPVGITISLTGTTLTANATTVVAMLHGPSGN